MSGSGNSGNPRMPPSTVLLVCVYNTQNVEITNQMMAYWYSFFGPLLKVLVFERGSTTKIFIEYLELKHAQYAVFLMDNGLLPGTQLRNNTYFSNITTIETDRVKRQLRPIWYNPMFYTNKYEYLLVYEPTQVQMMSDTFLNIFDFHKQQKEKYQFEEDLQDNIQVSWEDQNSNIESVAEIDQLILNNINFLLDQPTSLIMRKKSYETNASIDNEQQEKFQVKNFDQKNYYNMTETVTSQIS